MKPEANTGSADLLLQRFKRFFFDTALSTGPAALPSLLPFAGTGQILYGSDFPYAPAAVGASFTAKLDACADITHEQRSY